MVGPLSFRSDPPGLSRQLRPSELPRFRDHLLRLDPRSRRDRFNGAINDDFIIAYANRCFAEGTTVIAYVEGERVIGAAELHERADLARPTGEIAFSVEREWQRRGIGTALFERLIGAARSFGYELLRITTHPQNAAARAIARKFGAHLHFEDGDTVGFITLPPLLTVAPVGTLRGLGQVTAAAARETISETAEAQRQQKLAALRRTKFAATASLCLCVAVFAVARLYQGRWPCLGFVAAFAEAATIGGLADWYAVVALFRRPLGLPIPHTSIIPANQDRIADNLGRFVELNFLAPGPVRAKLQEVDFAALVAEWLADPGRAAGLSDFVGRLVPRALDAIEGSGLRGFLGQRALEQLGKVRIAPLAAELLIAVTEDRRHQKLFDELISLLERLLNDEAALAALRNKIRKELPSLFRFFQADAYLVKKIVASAGELFHEVLADQNHPLRHEFDRFVIGFIEALRDSPEYAARAEQLKHDLLLRPDLGSLADDIWKGVRDFVEQDLQAETSRTRERLAGLFVDAGRQLAADPQVRADMNGGFVVALAAFVESQKSGVSRFIADQVKGWDLGQLTRLIELNIGRDLQYIRFNGMLIGGLAGLVLYSAEHLVFAN